VTYIKADEVIRRYKSGETTKSLAQLKGVSERQIRRILQTANVLVHNRDRMMYDVDTGFFKHWSAEMAYVLGFILTDGHVVGNALTIAQKDREILERIASVMKTNAPIKRRCNGNSHIHTLIINRKEIVADLLALGITERKSLNVNFPEMSTEYIPHFIRGVTDGDGWVHERGYVMNVTSGSKPFADVLHTVFRDAGYNTRVTEQTFNGDTVYRTWVSGKDDIRKLGGWLYGNCGDLYLPRKRKRFEINAA
jgi:hypothetical protein